MYCEYCKEDGHDISDHKHDGPLCICGHYESDHHISWWSNGYKLVEECEFYGFNETGGYEPTENGWVDHCHLFKEYKV